MKYEELKNELVLLKQQLATLNDKITRIEKSLNEFDVHSNDIFVGLERNDKLLQGFLSFLSNVRNKKLGTIKDYCGELRRMRIKFTEYLDINIPYEIYEISDLTVLYKLKTLFHSNGDFIDLNRKSHNSLSAALNNYILFVEYNETDFILDE